MSRGLRDERPQVRPFVHRGLERGALRSTECSTLSVTPVRPQPGLTHISIISREPLAFTKIVQPMCCFYQNCSTQIFHFNL